MTDEQINQRIAEACGWTDFMVHLEFGLMGTPLDTHGLRTAVDYYTVDLNAMHEAEKLFNCPELYDGNLIKVCGGVEYLWHATARQRAEAFLRTIGKWEEAV